MNKYYYLLFAIVITIIIIVACVTHIMYNDEPDKKRSKRNKMV